MREPENIRAVLELQPDYMGFLMYPGSKRFIADLDPTVMSSIPVTVKTTGVFVDATLDDVKDAIDKYDFKAVQLHGNESPDYCSKLKGFAELIYAVGNVSETKSAAPVVNTDPITNADPMTNSDLLAIGDPVKVNDHVAETSKVEIIKAFGIDESFDFSRLAVYENVVDYFLFDTQTPDHGGSGKAFNWRLLENYTLKKPYFLSGGIGLENVPDLEQIEDDRFYAIDVNSRFELSPALKDIEKLTQFKKLLSC